MGFDAHNWARQWSPGSGPAKGDSVASQYTEDCERWNVSIDDRVVGREGITAFADGFMGALPDAVCEVRSVTEQGDRVVVEWTWQGTHAGDLPGWPATGGTMLLHGCNVITLVDGLIHREVSYWDKETLLRA
jgi:steroid delta-isomerase-like uncharacterized protein